MNSKFKIIISIVINSLLFIYVTATLCRFEYCEIPKCTDEEIEQMDLCTDVDCGVGGDCYLNK